MGSMRIVHRIIAVCITFLVFTGCEKDLSPMLTGGIWDFQDIITDSTSDSVRSSIALDKAFLVGSTLEFMSDGHYIIRLPLLTQPTRGIWTLTDNSRLLFDADNQPSSDAVILILTDDSLSYRVTYDDAGPDTYRVTTYWSR